MRGARLASTAARPAGHVLADDAQCIRESFVIPLEDEGVEWPEESGNGGARPGHARGVR